MTSRSSKPAGSRGTKEGGARRSSAAPSGSARRSASPGSGAPKRAAAKPAPASARGAASKSAGRVASAPGGKAGAFEARRSAPKKKAGYADAGRTANKASTHAVDEPVRVSKLLAERGMCSRREADSYIERGWVRVDGEQVELGAKAFPHQQISLDAPARKRQTERVTILLNKPVGYVSGQAEDGYRPAASLITPATRYAGDRSPREFQASHLRGLAPAGRLDIDSQGLLVLTQDGRIARQLIDEDSDIEKEYMVRVQGKLAANGLALLNHGLSLDGKPLRPAKVSWQNDDQLRFLLREGKKRQIRRMCEQVGLKVVGLKRMRMGRIVLADLPPGKWRYLGEHESFF